MAEWRAGRVIPSKGAQTPELGKHASCKRLYLTKVWILRQISMVRAKIVTKYQCIFLLKNYQVASWFFIPYNVYGSQSPLDTGNMFQRNNGNIWQKRAVSCQINCLNQGGGGLLCQIDFCGQIFFKHFLLICLLLFYICKWNDTQCPNLLLYSLCNKLMCE